MIRLDLLPAVLGDIQLVEFIGDNGSREYELKGTSLQLVGNVETELPLAADTMKALAGLMNAASQIMYDFDKEVAANGGKYPAAMSVSIASDIDTLLRTAMAYLVEAKQ